MIKLNKQQMDLLKKCLQKHSPGLITIIENPDSQNYSVEFYNQLRAIIGNELVISGLNEDDEPNEYGLNLESLIDEIGRLFL
ncbi:MAG: hypothetical protein KBI01_10050 [Oscillospiraceae bacterium]|nr:hypothetical protein [Oscillospiraceae bacterium]